jgi:hypothetical protein
MIGVFTSQPFGARLQSGQTVTSLQLQPSSVNSFRQTMFLPQVTGMPMLKQLNNVCQVSQPRLSSAQLGRNGPFLHNQLAYTSPRMEIEDSGSGVIVQVDSGHWHVNDDVGM